MKNIILTICFFLLSSTTFSQIYTERGKQLHFFAGTISGSLGYSYFYNKTQNKKSAIIAGICTSFMAGVSKELYDSAIMGNKMDPKDLLATTLGGITVSVTIPLFQKKKRYRRLDKVNGGYWYPNKN